MTLEKPRRQMFAASDSLPRGDAQEGFLEEVGQEINEEMARRKARH